MRPKKGVENYAGIVYVIGSWSTPLGQPVDKALVGMKWKEVVSLKCTKDYAYGDKHPDGATVTLSYEEIYSTEDGSFAKG